MQNDVLHPRSVERVGFLNCKVCYLQLVEVGDALQIHVGGAHIEEFLISTEDNC